MKKVYVREIGRNLKERLQDHHYVVKEGNMNNGTAAHAWESKPAIDCFSTKVKTDEMNSLKGRFWKQLKSINMNTHLA